MEESRATLDRIGVALYFGKEGALIAAHQLTLSNEIRHYTSDF
jgi:hypothetical protein